MEKNKLNKDFEKEIVRLAENKAWHDMKELQSKKIDVLIFLGIIITSTLIVLVGYSIKTIFTC